MGRGNKETTHQMEAEQYRRSIAWLCGIKFYKQKYKEAVNNTGRCGYVSGYQKGHVQRSKKELNTESENVLLRAQLLFSMYLKKAVCVFWINI